MLNIIYTFLVLLSLTLTPIKTMADTNTLPELFLLNEYKPDETVKFVKIDDIKYTGYKDVLERYPKFLDGKNIDTLVELYIHFSDIEPTNILITNIAEYESDYLKQLESENQNESPNPNRPKLSDWGTPVFSDMHSPKADGGKIIFFMKDNFTGLPYKAVGTKSDPSSVELNPVDIIPIEK